jgi:hypothetical protein
VSEAFSEADIDFEWLPTNLIAGARHYECAREAVIEADLMLPAKRFPDPLIYKIYDHYMWQCVNRRTPFGPIWHLRFVDPGPQDFPLSPFQSVVPKLEDPVGFSRDIEDCWRGFNCKPTYVSIRVPVGLSQQEAIEYSRQQYIREGACSKRGAGAVVRQHKTVLKYLGATRVLKRLIRQKGLLSAGKPKTRVNRVIWSALVAEAKALTEDLLGEPLLASDQEWAKAQRFTTQLLTQYQSEIEWLRQLFSKNPIRLVSEDRSAEDELWRQLFRRILSSL